ncbi:MAG: carboxylating nicotinate-nucleotide diphosphorylase [Nanoarchaeota archaeon]|nr:carboxylating nicotinate-nucleotide diphosphorylase [Nanoarchaeota archaeon]
MGNQKLLERAFQRGSQLTLKNPIYRDWIERFIVDEIQADVGTKGDITSRAVLPTKSSMKAVIMTRQSGVLAGLEEACFLFRKNGLKPIPKKKDGQRIKKGEIVLEIYGDTRELLRVERSVVDLLQRMSGIATLTSELVKKIKRRVHIAPTRKTQWRYLDKKAVFLGGGLTHRLALWESILIKDNHLYALKRQGVKDPITVSLQRAWKQKKKAVFIEIEVTTTKEALRAARVMQGLRKKGDACFIMLDNMPPQAIRATLKALDTHHLRDGIFIEASGGITPKNIASYAACDVDVLSSGFLTHSAPALDMCQLIL